ncbi:unnamed protein product [Miscanthus lutarioriparius]|uniref:Pectin lyase-like superfamily protein n=1 Tax=Miscanthus lutarioriparius TaxID=422564 RepID=A0A811SB36_9POAL|nr:unnamed protein product [Miscanthus lutarioriparius]
MSGGIQDVRAEDITAINSESGVRIKTAVGRGAYVKDVFVRRMTLTTMKWVFWMTGNYKSHPDDKYDPNAIPVVDSISYQDAAGGHPGRAVPGHLRRQRHRRAVQVQEVPLDVRRRRGRVG